MSSEIVSDSALMSILISEELGITLALLQAEFMAISRVSHTLHLPIVETQVNTLHEAAVVPQLVVDILLPTGLNDLSTTMFGNPRFGNLIFRNHWSTLLLFQGVASYIKNGSLCHCTLCNCTLSRRPLPKQTRLL